MLGFFNFFNKVSEDRLMNISKICEDRFVHLIDEVNRLKDAVNIRCGILERGLDSLRGGMVPPMPTMPNDSEGESFLKINNETKVMYWERDTDLWEKRVKKLENAIKVLRDDTHKNLRSLQIQLSDKMDVGELEKLKRSVKNLEVIVDSPCNPGVQGPAGKDVDPTEVEELKQRIRNLEVEVYKKRLNG